MFIHFKKEKASSDGSVEKSNPKRKFKLFGRRNEQGTKTAFKISKKFTVKKLIAMILIIAIAGGGGYGIWKIFFYSEPKQLVTGTTKKGSITKVIEGTATAAPTSSQLLKVPVDGTISKVYVSQGDKVAVGDKLYTMDTTTTESSIATLQSTISDNQTQLATYKQYVKDLTVTAPFSGKIINTKIEKDDKVNADATLATLVDDSKMLLSLYFSYAYENYIYTGTSVNVSVPDYMSTITGTVYSIDKVEYVTAEGTKCFKVNIVMDNPGSLTEGLSATATLSSSGMSISPAASGTLKYYKTKTISTDVSGTVSTLNIQDYIRVSAGDVLIELTNDTYSNQVKSLELKIASNQTTLKDLQTTLSECSPTATIAGTVIFVKIKAGDTVTSGTSSMAIYNTDTMTIEADIDETQNDYVTVGMEATLTKSGSTKTYTGTVTKVSLEATASNGVAYFPVTISIPSKGALSAGVYLTYSMTAAQASDVILAPVSAIKSTKYGKCLFIKADSKPDNAVELDKGVVPDGYYAVVVTTGLSDDSYVEIKSGVSEGVTVFEQYIESESKSSSSKTTSASATASPATQQQQGSMGGPPSGGMGGPPSGN